MKDFTKMVDVLNHVEETLVVDLLQHALSLEEKYTIPLIEPEKGLYLPGAFEPSFKEGVNYYIAAGMSSFSTAKPRDPSTGLYGKASKGTIVDEIASTPIASLDYIPKLREDVYGPDCAIVMYAEQLRVRARHFVKAPTIPAIAVRMAAGIVQQTMQRVCRHSTPAFHRYRPELLIKPQYLRRYEAPATDENAVEEIPDIIDSDEYMVAFENLLDRVMDFVGKHTWNFYTYRLKGTSLIIQKGIDWRVYKYYEALFEKQAEAVEED